MKDIKILLVDSEKNILFTYQSILEETYQIMVANNIEDALKILSSNSIDILITEYYLKGINTLDFISVVKERMPDIYVIMLTSTSLSTNHYQKIIESGVQDCFIKPFSINNLSAIIKKGLKIRGMLITKYSLEKQVNDFEKFLSNQKPQFYNNRFFLREIRQAFDRANRYKGSFSIILLEHNMGTNDLSKELSERINNTLLYKIRHTDMITRFNGTYGLLLPETTKGGIQHLCKRLLEVIRDLSLQNKGTLHKEMDQKIILTSATYPEEENKIMKIMKNVEKSN